MFYYFKDFYFVGTFNYFDYYNYTTLNYNFLFAELRKLIEILIKIIIFKGIGRCLVNRDFRDLGTL